MSEVAPAERRRVKLIDMLEEEKGELEDSVTLALNISINDPFTVHRELYSEEYSNTRVLEFKSIDSNGNVYIDRFDIHVEHVRRAKEV